MSILRKTSLTLIFLATLLAFTNQLMAKNVAATTPATLDFTSTDDLRTIIKQNVKSHGAVGDGISDDYAAIQETINYVSTLPRGGVVYLPAGRYLLKTGLKVTSANVKLKGDGKFQSLLVTNTDITDLTIGTNPITGITGCDVVDLGFYHSNLTVKVKPHIVLISLIQSKIRAWLQNGAYGLAVYGGQGINIEIYAPGKYDVESNLKLNSTQAISLYAASTLAGYKLGIGAVDLPTEVNFDSIYLNGPRLKGWQYGVAIYAGEHITFSGDYYVGQSSINNIHIEQDTSNKLILEVKLERGGYIDAAGKQAIYIGGPLGNGSQYIGGISIDSDIKGQSGDGQTGIYVDGKARSGLFSQAVRNLSINANVSGFSGNGIEISGGVNITITGTKSWGNSFITKNNGYGLLFGPGVTGAVVTGGHFGGGTFGDSKGNQTAGIGIDAGAHNVSLTGVDVRGNQTPIIYTANSDTSGNRITSCAGFNENRSPIIPRMPASGVDFVNPYGSPANILISGGDFSNIKLNGELLFKNIPLGLIYIGPGDILNITYSSQPSWKWWPQ